MTVKVLQQEARERAKLEAAHRRSAIENAYKEYEAGRYSAAVEGLELCVRKNNDALALVCLANILWRGLAGKVDRDLAAS